VLQSILTIEGTLWTLGELLVQMAESSFPVLRRVQQAAFRQRQIQVARRVVQGCLHVQKVIVMRLLVEVKLKRWWSDLSTSRQ